MAEKSAGSALAEMRKEILAKVSTLESTMQKLYYEFFIMHKVVVHLYGFQQWSRKVVQTFNGIDASIAHVQEWIMRYKRAPLYLHNMMKLQAKLEKARIHMLIQNYKKLTPFITNIKASYAWFYKTLEVMVRTHRIPSIGSLNKANKKNQV